MKKWVLLLLCIFSVPRLWADEVSRAQQILNWIMTGQNDSLELTLHPDVRIMEQAKEKIVENCQQWKALEEELGGLVKQSPMRLVYDDTFKVEQCRLIFKNGKALFSLVTDKEQYVMGFNFSIIPSPPADEFEKVGKCRSYEEVDTVVVNGRLRLPAIYCRPVGEESPFTVVVIVHGSGPLDRDGTIGANQPYKELAHRLAANGVASLRYDKRTFVYGARTGEMSGSITYDSEIVDDALKALELAAHLPDADKDRIYVLGHSIGGMLAPRIAMLSPVPLAGMIACAAPSRPLKDLILSHFRYLSRMQGGTEDQADSLAEIIYKKMPVIYRSFAAEYNPVGTARGLRMPMLFLQGGYDFMATDADFNLWKKGLEGHNDVSFVWLRNCDHLMREQRKMADPEAYVRPGRLSTLAVNAILSFLKER